MTSINNISAQQSHTINEATKGSFSPLALMRKTTSRLLSVLYSWQNWPNDKSQNQGRSEITFRDIGPSKQDEQTDYGKPIWRR